MSAAWTKDKEIDGYEFWLLIFYHSDGSTNREWWESESDCIIRAHELMDYWGQFE